MKRALKWTAGLAAAILGVLGVALAWVHADIRSINPGLPAPESVLAPAGGDTSSWPVRIRYLNTGSQPMARSMVLDPSQDPEPDRPYIMSYVSFALEWRDGGIFLIDTGLPREAAVAFGKPAELLGAEPTQAHGGVVEQLGKDVRRVAGIAFTHLHHDHTSGLANLCSRLERLEIFQTPNQLERGNYTTNTSEQQIENAGCATRRRLEGGDLLPIPGFPGLFVIQAAGHTPGSQVFVAHVAGECDGCAPKTFVFSGDIVNHIDGVRKNLPKPSLYSLLTVPESPKRLDQMRRFLRVLADEHGARLLVSHDQLQIESSEIEAW